VNQPAFRQISARVRGIPRIVLALAAPLVLAGCEAIGTIFEAGVWVGVLVVIAIVALVAVLAAMFRR
jgi:hypothetical protein